MGLGLMTWLFGLGAMAIAFPILFHLIRRTPKGQTEFSSLMFLKPSPPTLTRRSRLENWLLLLMRSLAIALVAIAFMRPFFRGSDSLSEFEIANRRVVVLLDTSASMQRAGLWDQAKSSVVSVLSELEDGDDVSLLTFDSKVSQVVPFSDGSQVGANQASAISGALQTLEPSWERSDLGKARVSVAERLDVWRDSQRAKDGTTTAKLQIVVVSDLQKGSKTGALQAFQWPADVYVKFLTVQPKDYSNATVQLLDRVPEEEDPSLRIRVLNSEDSSYEQFSVSWTEETAATQTAPVSFYVSPGTSRVLKVDPDQASFARKFVVTGDNEIFDNTYYVVPTEQQALDIAYIGEDGPNDAEQLQFYLKRGLIDTPSRKFRLRQLGVGDLLRAPGVPPPTLVVVGAVLDQAKQEEVDQYLEGGGTVLFVLSNKKVADSVERWTLAHAVAEQAEKKRDRTNYLMLAEIDFSSQLFKPFANPRFNDFTRIRFWRNSTVLVDEDKAHVLARFDNDDPAVWRVGSQTGGTVFAMASGWNPSDSQLALSTKFVPWINSLVEIAANAPELNKSILVGMPIQFPAAPANAKRSMIKPDGTVEVVEADQIRFDGVDQPGIYRLLTKPSTSRVRGDDEKSSLTPDANDVTRNGELQFAVNVDRAESATATIPIEQLEMFEVKVGDQETASNELAMMKEMRDRDIENRQKFWKWLIFGAIVLLIGETWLAGRTESRMLTERTPTFQSSGISGELS